MKRLLIILALVGGVACGLPFGNLGWVQAEDLCVVSYNVENLFHPKHDTVVERVRGLEVSGLEVSGLEVSGLVEKDDWEWTPEGERRWSYSRYYRKVENIARVLTNIGEWDGVDVVGLQEVENALCLKRLCNTLRRGEYDFVHYESPDPRGIDVALIYKKTRIDTIATRAIPVRGLEVSGLEVSGLEVSGLEVSGLEDELITRDILYVCAKIKAKREGLKVNGDTIHFFVCHLPSQRGGKAESEWKRQAAKQVLQQAVDSVYGTNPKAKIVVMGDMNSGELRMRGLEDERMKGEGTHKYQGRWTFLDHFYVSPSIDSISEARIYDAEWIQETDEKYLGLRPKRTFNGYRYQKDGFSDHLPILLKLRIRG